MALKNPEVSAGGDLLSKRAALPAGGLTLCSCVVSEARVSAAVHAALHSGSSERQTDGARGDVW